MVESWKSYTFSRLLWKKRWVPKQLLLDASKRWQLSFGGSPAAGPLAEISHNPEEGSTTWRKAANTAKRSVEKFKRRRRDRGIQCGRALHSSQKEAGKESMWLGSCNCCQPGHFRKWESTKQEKPPLARKNKMSEKTTTSAGTRAS